MAYVIIINSSPLTALGSLSAYRFCQALITNNHQISLIFFIQDAVFNGISQPEFPYDEFNLNEAWSEFAQHNKLILELCSTALIRRGINQDQLASGFKISSLANLYTILAADQKVITFH